MLAAQSASPGAVQLLLERGATVDAQAADGMTALLAAAADGDASIARLLLASGADVKTTNRDGKTALILAGRRR